MQWLILATPRSQRNRPSQKTSRCRSTKEHSAGRKESKRQIYFGKVADDPKDERAINLWLDKKDDLIAGRVTKTDNQGLRLTNLCNHFLTHKKRIG